MARGKLRRWQTIAAACAVLFVATGGLLLSDRWTRPSESVQSPDPVPRRARQWFAREDIPAAEHLPTSLELDAWQVPEPFPSDVTPADEIDPRLRSFTVGALTRKIFEP